MQYIDIRGTSQENIAKEVEEIAKRRGMELEFQVIYLNIVISVDICWVKLIDFRTFGVSVAASAVVVIQFKNLKHKHCSFAIFLIAY